MRRGYWFWWIREFRKSRRQAFKKITAVSLVKVGVTSNFERRVTLSKAVVH